MKARSKSKSISKSRTRSRLSKRTKSMPLIKIKNSKTLKTVVSVIPDISLKNMSIQDKNYKTLVKRDYKKMLINYKEKVTNKKMVTSLKKSIKLQKKIKSKNHKSSITTLKKRSKSKSKSPTGIMDL